MKCRWKRLGQHQLELLIRLCSPSNSMKCEWKRFANHQLELWWLQLNLMKCGWKKIGGGVSSTKAPCSFTNDRWKKFDEKKLEFDEKFTINHDEMWMKKPWVNSQACEGGGAMAMGRMSNFKSLYVVLCATYYFFLLSFCSMRSNFCKEFKIVEFTTRNILFYYCEWRGRKWKWHVFECLVLFKVLKC